MIHDLGFTMVSTALEGSLEYMFLQENVSTTEIGALEPLDGGLVILECKVAQFA